jgi:RNA polymerase sigma-70 factor (ECF subfamily)
MSEKHITYEKQFLEAYDQYADAIFRFCLFKTSNRDLALDLAQDTFTKTWDYLQNGKKVKNIQAFLYQVARNLIIDYHRKKKSQSLDTILDSGLEFEDPNDNREQYEFAIDSKLAFQLLEDIGDSYKEVLLLRYVDQLQVQEIAQILNEKENTISVRIHRALDKLKTLLEEQQP